MSDPVSMAVHDVNAERVRQVHGKGSTAAHDDHHHPCELTAAAAADALAGTLDPHRL